MGLKVKAHPRDTGVISHQSSVNSQQSTMTDGATGIDITPKMGDRAHKAQARLS